MAEREYLVYEDMEAANVWSVRARNKAEALRKAREGLSGDPGIECIYTTTMRPTGRWSVSLASAPTEEAGR